MQVTQSGAHTLDRRLRRVGGAGAPPERALRDARADQPPVGGPEGHAPSEHEHVLDRLQNLRAIVPVFAQELASARRQAAELRRENNRLLQRIRELQRAGGARR